MTTLMGAAVSGAGVGLVVAVPPGALSLLVATSGRHGRRAATAAASGVASADLVWATLAATGGAALVRSPAVDPASTAAHGVLVVLGVVMLVRAVRLTRRARSPVPYPAGTGRGGGHPARWYLTTLALTLPNPLTVSVFLAAAVRVGARSGAEGDLLAGVGVAAAFVLAATAVSLGWHLLLAHGGRHALTGRGPRVEAVLTAACGAGLVVWTLL